MLVRTGSGSDPVSTGANNLVEPLAVLTELKQTSSSEEGPKDHRLQIDEFIIHVIPIFIGEGIPLVQPRHRTIPLEFLSMKSWPDGVVRLHYGVSPQLEQQLMRKRAPRAKNNKKPPH